MAAMMTNTIVVNPIADLLSMIKIIYQQIKTTNLYSCVSSLIEWTNINVLLNRNTKAAYQSPPKSYLNREAQLILKNQTKWKALKIN